MKARNFIDSWKEIDPHPCSFRSYFRPIALNSGRICGPNDPLQIASQMFGHIGGPLAMTYGAFPHLQSGPLFQIRKKVNLFLAFFRDRWHLKTSSLRGRKRTLNLLRILDVVTPILSNRSEIWPKLRTARSSTNCWRIFWPRLRTTCRYKQHISSVAGRAFVVSTKNGRTRGTLAAP